MRRYLVLFINSALGPWFELIPRLVQWTDDPERLERPRVAADGPVIAAEVLCY